LYLNSKIDLSIKFGTKVTCRNLDSISTWKTKIKFEQTVYQNADGLLVLNGDGQVKIIICNEYDNLVKGGIHVEFGFLTVFLVTNLGEY
jgi:hypothetical protein